MRWAILVLAGVQVISPAWGMGRFIGGNELKRMCESPAGCVQYVQGAWDALEAARRGTTCPSSEMEAGQLADIVLKYLNDNPQMRGDSGGTIVGLAVQAAYQCGAFPRGHIYSISAQKK